MKTDPDLKVWAECLIEIVKHSSLSNDQLVSVIEDNLDEIADKYYQIGLNQGWAIEQDKSIYNTRAGLGREHLVQEGKPYHGSMCACPNCNGDPK